MAKTIKKETAGKKNDADAAPKKSFKITRQHKVVFGCLLVLFAISLLLAFISFYIYGQYDQSAISELNDRSVTVQNWLGKFGAFLANIFVYKGFGVGAFLFVRLFFLTGAYLVLDLSVKKLKNIWFWDLFAMVIISVLFGFFAHFLPELGGIIGFEMNLFLQDYIGKSGTLLVLLFGLIIYLIFKIKISPDSIKTLFEKTKKDLTEDLDSIKTPSTQSTYNLEEFAVSDETEIEEFVDEEEDLELEKIVIKPASQFEINKDALKPTINSSSELILEPTIKPSVLEITPSVLEIEPPLQHVEEEFIVEKVAEEDIIEENLASRLVADFGLFDPTLELSNFKFPTLDLLKEYTTGGITINQEELEENKNRIVETLRNYKIEIAQIKATVGPSVTLYEIVPEAGIRISKIKSLEDDIALSLSALGIRIIAPIPGKGSE